MKDNEMRMMWLMVLVIVAVSAWFLHVPYLSYACGAAFVVSIIQYVDQIQLNLKQTTEQQAIILKPLSRTPLYLSSGVMGFGALLDSGWMVSIGLTFWIFFLLRWLKHLEGQMNHIRMLLQSTSTLQPSLATSWQVPQTIHQVASNPMDYPQLGVLAKAQHWFLQGNPVLKGAVLILFIGLILLLRFAVEEWQLSLATKLSLVAIACVITVAGGLYLAKKQTNFAIAMQGLGLAGLFLTLFFSYQYHVLVQLSAILFCFVIIMALTFVLSLKQRSIELAIMAIVAAYIAPFSLPQLDLSSIEFLAYYLLINLAVAGLSSIQPWKYLNHLAFMVTVSVAGLYGLIHFDATQRVGLSLLIVLHSLIFIWLGFRYSQLLSQQHQPQFQLQPIVDLGFIFSVPLIAYGYLYVLYFHQMFWQLSLSLLYVAIFASCSAMLKRYAVVPLIAQCYFSLMLVFLLLIVPILAPEQWSVAAWAIEGVLVYSVALIRQSAWMRYFALVVLVMAGCTGIYYGLKLTYYPSEVYWILAVVYCVVVVIAQCKDQFRQQLTSWDSAWHSCLLFVASMLWIGVFHDVLLYPQKLLLALLLTSVIYLIMNEIALYFRATWTWLLPKWIGILPVYYMMLLLLLQWGDVSGRIAWPNQTAQILFAGLGALLSVFWLRPLLGVKQEREWVSFGALLSLSLCSIAWMTPLSYVSMVLLPLLFCIWCYWRVDDSNWSIFWQTRSSLMCMVMWLFFSQLLETQWSHYYFLPILNPFDGVSLAMLCAFIWMLLQQAQVGRDRGILAVLAVVASLWISSYILLRALHMYLATPFNEMEVWDNPLLQLCLTTLWVSLAFLSMWFATQRKLKALWILGGSILLIVSLKLVLFDLANIGTLLRVLSFFIAGGVMLLIAYIAPMPDHDQPK